MQAPYPLKTYKRISSKFGWRCFDFKNRRIVDHHNGWDYSAEEGTPIYANVEGTCYIGWDADGFGNYIMIAGKTSQDNLYQVYFGHIKSHSFKVSHGQRVKVGTQIAEVGDTGLSTAPHLHWEFRLFKNRKFRAIDPKLVLNNEISYT